MGPLVVRDRPLCFVEGYLGQPIDNHGPANSGNKAFGQGLLCPVKELKVFRSQVGRVYQ